MTNVNNTTKPTKFAKLVMAYANTATKFAMTTIYKTTKLTINFINKYFSLIIIYFNLLFI